ncbi:hypothetical protein Tco_1289331 [Tanacetum coccineum]
MLDSDLQNMIDSDKMAEENLPAPTRSDEQLVPAKACLPYEKSNISILCISKCSFYLQTAVLEHSDIGSKDWCIQITPVVPANPFVSPSAGEVVMDFINELGYPEAIHLVSYMHVNHLYQPWRAILSLINQCLTGKTSGNDKPRHPVLQMLWGIVTRTNVDYAELLWEEFVQGIQTFFTHRDSNKIPSKKPTPHVIPYCRFTKLIIYYLGSKYNIHGRPESPRHVTGDDFLLGNLKFVPKGENDDVFVMHIPNELITEDIQRSEYYKQYVEMASRKVQVKEGGKKKTAPKTDKPVKPAPAKQSKPATSKQPKPKPVKEKSTKPTPLQKANKGKVMKFRKGKSPLQLIDEEKAEHEPEPEPQGKGEEYDVERAIQMSLESFQAHGQTHVGGVAIRELVAEATRPLPVTSTTDQYIFQRRIPVTEEASTGPSAQPKDDTSGNIVRETPSPTDAETGATTDKTNSEGDIEILNIGEEQGEDVADKVNLEEKTAKIDEGQARSDASKTPESQPPPERVLMEEDRVGPDPGQSHVALAGPDPEPMHDDFIATMYP